VAHAICMHVDVVLIANGTGRSVVKLLAMDCIKDSIAGRVLVLSSSLPCPQDLWCPTQSWMCGQSVTLTAYVNVRPRWRMC
jgi:hypothetical protein